MGSVVVDLLLMVLGLQVLGYGPQAECQYYHHPLTVGWFLGEKLHKLELMQVMCLRQAGYSVVWIARFQPVKMNNLAFSPTTSVMDTIDNTRQFLHHTKWPTPRTM